MAQVKPAVAMIDMLLRGVGQVMFQNNPITDSCGGVLKRVEKEEWRILPVGEVHDQPAALAGGHRRNAPWQKVSRNPQERLELSLSH